MAELAGNLVDEERVKCLGNYIGRNLGQLEKNTYAGVGAPNGINHIGTSSQEKNVQEEVVELHLSPKV